MRMIATLLCASLAACSVGDGTGEVQGQTLLDGCYPEGNYVLGPSAFFAQATDELLRLRIQRGSDLEVASDGLALLVRDSSLVRESWLGRELPLTSTTNTDPIIDAGLDPTVPVVDVTAYFNETCPPGRSKTPTALKAVGGTIRFDAIYAPKVDAKEVRISAVLTGARFMREGDSVSYALLSGNFDFLYVRGRPAQRFP